MLRLGLEAAERFVDSYDNAFWDGWTIVFFRPTETGEFRTNGMYYNGKWGISNRVGPDSNGVYRFRVR
jgi:hypothetical protein